MSTQSRSIIEVTIACKDQQPVTEEELRLAVVALSHMLYSVERAERALADAVIAGKPTAKMRAEFVASEAEIRFKSKKLPLREYLGPEYTPGTPENQRLCRQAKAVFEHATGQKLDEGNT